MSDLSAMTAARLAPAHRLDAPPDGVHVTPLARAAGIRDALRGLQLGKWDETGVAMLAGEGPVLARTVVAWLRRVRQYAMLGAANPAGYPDPLGAWDVPLDLVAVGDEAWRCRVDGTSGWAEVTGVVECEDPACPLPDGTCTGVLLFAGGGEEHMAVGDFPTIRIPDMDMPTVPALPGASQVSRPDPWAGTEGEDHE